jgi:hypothetical protein
MFAALQGKSVELDTGEKLSHLVRFRRSVNVLENHDLTYALTSVDAVRSFLAPEDESERFREPAKIPESEAGGVVRSQLKELGRPHSDIIGDII